MNLKDVDLSKIADITDGFSGADLRAVSVEAGMFAIRDGNDFVTQREFLKAVEKINLQRNKSSQSGKNLEMFV
jgi:proteasome regulatory subunit